MDNAAIFPANLYIAPKDRLNEILNAIQDEMTAQEKYFIKEGRLLEARRIKERTTFDIEMIRELGYCSGIENYSRFFDRREPGARPFCLLDYFPDDYLMIVDESHVTIPQVRGKTRRKTRSPRPIPRRNPSRKPTPRRKTTARPAWS